MPELTDQVFPLPPYAHIPGRNPRHSDELFINVKLATPKTTVSETASDNLAWHYGLELIRQGYFWECHEVLEPVWMNAAPNSKEKVLVQAVIQMANAALKRTMAREPATQRLCKIAQELLQRVSDHESIMGVTIDSTLKALKNFQVDHKESEIMIYISQYGKKS
jgi:predicted metal-dependent hydrolase